MILTGYHERWRGLYRIACAMAFALAVSGGAARADSTCFGTTSNGRLEGACKLPAKGDNFSAYSSMLRLAGRTHVHCTVQSIILDAYAALAEQRPHTSFVYGETGLKKGGRFKPHKTHQNGLSVDFMVPVRDAEGDSVPLPTSVLNKFGYDIEFSSTGRYEDLSIDYEAITAHLAALSHAASRHGVGIWRVIFDPKLQKALEETDAWTEVSSLTFNQRPSWVRHDEHYHVDFLIPCEGMPQK